MSRFIIVTTLITLLSGCAKTVYVDEHGNEITQPEQIDYLPGAEGRFEVVEKVGTHLTEARDTSTGVHYYYYNVSGTSGLAPVYEADGGVRVTN